MRSEEILTAGHVRRWPEILRFWGFVSLYKHINSLRTA